MQSKAKFQDLIKSTKILIGKIIKQGGMTNHMKNILLKLSNSHKKCFINHRENYYKLVNYN